MTKYHISTPATQGTIKVAAPETPAVEAPPAASAHTEVVAVPAASAPASDLSTPNPAIPFAILRNAHEGLRGGIKSMNTFVEDPELFKKHWTDYQRALSVCSTVHEVVAV